jgi:hypothetical protein
MTRYNIRGVYCVNNVEMCVTSRVQCYLPTLKKNAQ